MANRERPRVRISSASSRQHWFLGDVGSDVGFINYLRKSDLIPKASVTSICESAGMSRENFYAIAAGKRTPSIEKLVALFTALGLKVHPVNKTAGGPDLGLTVGDVQFFVFHRQGVPRNAPFRSSLRNRSVTDKLAADIAQITESCLQFSQDERDEVLQLVASIRNRRLMQMFGRTWRSTPLDADDYIGYDLKDLRRD